LFFVIIVINLLPLLLLLLVLGLPAVSAANQGDSPFRYHRFLDSGLVLDTNSSSFKPLKVKVKLKGNEIILIKR